MRRPPNEHPADRDADHRSRASRACHRLPPPASWPRTVDHRRRTHGSATTGGSSGTHCACTRQRSTTGFRACRSPRPAGTARRRTRSATIWSDTRCTSTYRCGPALGWTASRRDQAVGTSRQSATSVISCDNVVVATGTFGRTPNVPGFAADLEPSIQQLHSSPVPAAGPAATRTCSGRRRVPFGAGHRLRARRVPPKQSCAARTAATFRSARNLDALT